MEHEKMCRVCLVINVKMYSIDLPLLFTAYSQFTGYKITDLYRYICFQCAALLRKCFAFKLKCQRAQGILDNEVMPISENILIRFRELLHSPLKLTSSVITVIEPTDTKEVKRTLTEVKEEINDKPKKFEIKEKEYNELNDEYAIDDTIQYNDDISDEIDQVSKKKKKRKSTSIKINVKSITSIFDDADDEPLSKIIKNKKDKVRKVASKQKSTSRNQKFDISQFEEFTTITVLSYTDAKREVEHRKESSNYKDCLFKCSLCYRGFEAQKAFDNHMKKHSSVNGNIECEICHLRFKQNIGLTKHITSCHKKKYSCKICPYVCFCSSQARSHINLHKGIKYTCEQCGETFSMPNTLCMHKRMKHATECVCALCGSTFATQRGLQGHIKLTHIQEANEEKGPKCDDCDVQFSTEIAWKRHLVLSAKHTTSNGCVYCGESFSDAGALKRHARTHSRKQRSRADVQLPASCPLCAHWLTDREAYKTHVTSSHPDSDDARRIQAKESRPVVCEVCGKRFTKPCFLRYHQRVHTGERPYTCNICDKTFVFPGTLAAHRAVHVAHTSRHKCAMCTKRFVYRSALNKHVRTFHLNERPHKCGACGKSFPTRCEVKYHAQYVHCKVPWPKRDRSKKATIKVTDEHKKWEPQENN